MTEYQKKGDVVFTPDWVARDIVDYFNPTGIILDPLWRKSVEHERMCDYLIWKEGKKDDSKE